MQSYWVCKRGDVKLPGKYMSDVGALVEITITKAECPGNIHYNRSDGDGWVRTLESFIEKFTPVEAVNDGGYIPEFCDIAELIVRGKKTTGVHINRHNFTGGVWIIPILDGHWVSVSRPSSKDNFKVIKKIGHLNSLETDASDKTARIAMNVYLYNLT